MICQNCGRDILENSLFCTYCGTKIEPVPASESEAPKEPEPLQEPLPEPITSPTPGQGSAPQYGSLQDSASQYGTQQYGTQQYGTPQSSTGQPPMQPMQPTQPMQPMQPTQPMQPMQPMQSTYVGYTGAPQQPPKAPKSKKTLAIVVSIGAVVFVALAVFLVIYFVNQGSTTNSNTSVIEGTGTNNGNGGNGGNGGGETVTPPTPSEKTLVDNDVCKITINSQSYDASLDWIEVEVMVENKTDKELWFFFDSDVTADGLSDPYGVFLSPDDTSLGVTFPAKKTTKGTIVFIDPPTSKKIANFAGTLIIYDDETYDELGKYKFSIPAID